jgi:hypothetical protein
MDQKLRDTAIAAGRESFMRTTGRISPRFELLARHAPDTFAGYAMMRAALMRDTAEGGALPLATKDLPSSTWWWARPRGRACTPATPSAAASRWNNWLRR